MLTAARLVAGILFGALCWYVTELMKPLMPEGFNPRIGSEVSAVVGFVTGWIVLGTRAGKGTIPAISFGFTAAIVAAFWCLFFNCLLEMIRLAFTGRYKGPADAVIDVFQQMMRFGALLLTPNVLATLVIGGMVAGVITEMTNRRFR